MVRKMGVELTNLLLEIFTKDIGYRGLDMLKEGMIKFIYLRYIWQNGESYVGEWKNDSMNGKGIFTRADGSKFEG